MTAEQHGVVKVYDVRCTGQICRTISLGDNRGFGQLKWFWNGFNNKEENASYADFGGYVVSSRVSKPEESGNINIHKFKHEFAKKTKSMYPLNSSNTIIDFE